MKIEKIFYLVLFLSIGQISAQVDQHPYDPLVVHGSVSVMENNQKVSLPGASVHWSGTATGTTTDENGQFTTHTVRQTNLLVISYTGYENDTLKYQGDDMNITLEKGVELSPIDIVNRDDGTVLSLLDPLNVQTLSSRELRKAACCNLSESFETNASIDASFTDAVSGTRQIKMLGLSGRYSQILKDNIPNVRGLSTTYGLGYIPGDWIKDIHISKGAGSVTSGFESMTGEINVALKDAHTKDRGGINLYGNQVGRLELNTYHPFKVSDTFSTILLVHGEWNGQEMDRNKDNFMDNPIKKDFAVRNQWKWQAKENWEGQYSINLLSQNNRSGQLDFENEWSSSLWQMTLLADRIEAGAKTGYVFDDDWGSSIGSQFNYDHYEVSLSTPSHHYSGQQSTARANILYATNIGCAKKALTIGATYLNDDYKNRLDTLDLSRQEEVLGLYGEFTWNANEKLQTITGMRVDQHNIFGTMYSPRMHLRYSISEDMSIKGAAGRGYRTVNPVMDNLGLLASNRRWSIESPVYQESAWNMGVNLTYKFRLDYRDATLSFDTYRTVFDQMAVVDFESPGHVQVYGLDDGRSFSNTSQVEFGWEMLRRTDIRLAYRYTDAQTTYRSGQRTNPFTPRHRGFFNLSYETKGNDSGSKWLFDGTLQLIGEQRMPDRFANPAGSVILSRPDSPTFLQAHGQVNRVFKEGLEVYLGVENAGDFRQEEPILNDDQAFSNGFDASQVYGPVFGRMFYLGFRWTLL